MGDMLVPLLTVVLVANRRRPTPIIDTWGRHEQGRFLTHDNSLEMINDDGGGCSMTLRLSRRLFPNTRPTIFDENREQTTLAPAAVPLCTIPSAKTTTRSRAPPRPQEQNFPFLPSTHPDEKKDGINNDPTSKITSSRNEETVPN